MRYESEKLGIRRPQPPVSLDNLERGEGAQPPENRRRGREKGAEKVYSRVFQGNMEFQSSERALAWLELRGRIPRT